MWRLGNIHIAHVFLLIACLGESWFFVGLAAVFLIVEDVFTKPEKKNANDNNPR